MASRPGQDMIGYHATNASAARKILANGFRCGSKGLAGGAIYFATSEQHASRKSNNGNDIVLKCQVALGRTLTLDDDGDPNMTLDKLNGMGYDSVKILRTGDEYAVYEPWRVHVLSDGHQSFPPPPPPTVVHAAPVLGRSGIPMRNVSRPTGGSQGGGGFYTFDPSPHYHGFDVVSYYYQMGF